ncbi:MAG TPA: hypothetical protein VM406_07535 [Noviherbaspirillum sp.]|nr:hypothetical protein [Noviherbaspirillum sp.]
MNKNLLIASLLALALTACGQKEEAAAPAQEPAPVAAAPAEEAAAPAEEAQAEGEAKAEGEAQPTDAQAAAEQPAGEAPKQ